MLTIFHEVDLEVTVSDANRVAALAKTDSFAAPMVHASPMEISRLTLFNTF